MTRIKLRIDEQSAYEGVPNATLNQGEIALAVDLDAELVSARLGTQDTQAFPDTVQISRTPLGAGGFPLTAGSIGTISDGSVVQFDGSVWSSDASSIEFSADSPSGVLTYTASTDTWATDTSSFVPSSLDGGTFTGSFVAPSFSASYQPTIGDN